MRKFLLLALFVPFITSCGGGSSESGGGVVNLPPRLTSSLNVSVAENDAGFVYIASATDPEGNTVSISLQPGGDAARFNYDENSNELRFAATPDFENPDDENGDNIYNLTFRISDGNLSPLITVVLTVTDVNEAPEFTSDNLVTTQENISSGFYSATADDPEGNVLSFAISPGQDSDAFEINSASGELRFEPAPDFERPRDGDRDNIYELTLEVSDGNLTDDLALSVEVTDEQQNIQVRRVATGLSLPVYITPLLDGSSRIIVLQKAGRARLINPNTGEIDPVDFMDITTDISAAGENGLLALAFSPNFETDETFYVFCSNVDGDTEIRRYKTLPGDPTRGDVSTKDVILVIPQTRNSHNGGWLGFDENGLLFLPIGDGVNLNGPQDDNSLLGKLLRINVSGDDFPADDLRDYKIPPGNMFDGNPGAGRPEIFSKGLRNPFRASFDPLTGDLILTDVGGNRREEINRLPITDATRNYGWPQVEGTQDLFGTQQPEYTLPTSEYAHGDGEREGASITGGHVYQGPVEALQDHYIFGDFVNNRFWAVPISDLVDGELLSSDNYIVLTDDFTPDVSDYNLVSSFGLDKDENLYIASYFGGEIFRMEAE